MKRTLLTLCLLLLIAAPALAHQKKCEAFTELTGAFSYTNPEHGKAEWTLGGEVLWPLLKDGYLYIGPALTIHDGAVDSQSAGAVGEWRFTGVNGPFVRASVAYDLDQKKNFDQHTVDAAGGFIFAAGKSGAIKLYAERSVSGYGKSNDLRGVGSISLRF